MTDFLTTLTETSSDLPVIGTLVDFVLDAVAAIEGIFTDPDTGNGGGEE
ncbi:hypothetical protein [Corynebacterium maris]|nr:hypothetical protein [Corynebacterium maris]